MPELILAIKQVVDRVNSQGVPAGYGHDLTDCLGRRCPRCELARQTHPWTDSKTGSRRARPREKSSGEPMRTGQEAEVASAARQTKECVRNVAIGTTRGSSSSHGAGLLNPLYDSTD